MSTTTSSKSSAKSSGQGPQVGPYIFGKTLGTGSTGKVKLAKNVDSGELVAVKIIRKDYLDRKPSLRRKLQREITVMKICDHENVLKLLDVFEIDTHLFLVIEYVEGSDFFDYLIKKGSLTPDEALEFFHQIIAGLDYCHRRLICHRDLKPENLLLDKNMQIKIADFGMTNLNPPGSLLETSCGSPHYAAPEVVSGEMYSGLQADIWSCGVILYAMLTGRLPFDDDNIQRLLNKVQRGVVHIPSDMAPECKSLVKAMLTVDPLKRITIEGIKNHPWYMSKPPKQHEDDDFVAPVAPILDPMPEVVKSLVELGWGDHDTVIAELAKEEENLEKVFYSQLLRHPFYQRKLEEKQKVVAAAEASADHNNDNVAKSDKGAGGTSAADVGLTSNQGEFGAKATGAGQVVASREAHAASDVTTATASAAVSGPEQVKIQAPIPDKISANSTTDGKKIAGWLPPEWRDAYVRSKTQTKANNQIDDEAAAAARAAIQAAYNSSSPEIPVAESCEFETTETTETIEAPDGTTTTTTTVTTATATATATTIRTQIDAEVPLTAESARASTIKITAIENDAVRVIESTTISNVGDAATALQTTAIPKSTSLVRQTDYLKPPEEKKEEQEIKITPAPVMTTAGATSSGSKAPPPNFSWFESFKTYFSQSQNNNNSKKESNNPSSSST